MTDHLPPVGAVIVQGRVHYRVKRHGCAVLSDTCPHGPDAITVARIARSGNEWATTECLNGYAVTVTEPKPG